jgi:hypothetical protein
MKAESLVIRHESLGIFLTTKDERLTTFGVLA